VYLNAKLLRIEHIIFNCKSSAVTTTLLSHMLLLLFNCDSVIRSCLPFSARFKCGQLIQSPGSDVSL